MASCKTQKLAKLKLFLLPNRISLVATQGQAISKFRYKKQFKCTKVSGKNGRERLTDMIEKTQGQVQDDGQPKFSLYKAVLLAGCAFEAYLDPSSKVKQKQQMGEDVFVTYLNKQYVQDQYRAVLQVTLKSAKGLDKADFWGKSDPYVVLNLGDSFGKSTVKFHTLEPEWNEQFSLYLKKQEQNNILKIRVFDHDNMQDDDDLGVVFVDVSEKLDGKAHDIDVQLKQGQGSIQLEIKSVNIESSELTGDMQSIIGSISDQSIQMLPEQWQGIGQAFFKGMEQQEQSIKNETLTQLDEKTGGKIQENDQQNAVFEKMQPQFEEWKSLAVLAGRDVEDSFNHIAYIDDRPVGTQAWIYSNDQKKEAVVSFRGTEMSSIKDYVTDLSVMPVTFSPERVGGLFSKDHIKEVQVHSGFYQSYIQIRRVVLKILQTIIPESQGNHSNEKWTIYITGHSLGGALATILAYELAAIGLENRKYHICMYNYGSPRVGNKNFKQEYDKLVPDSWRLTTLKDLIPTIPRLMGYAHVDHCVYLDRDGTIDIQGNLRDQNLEGQEINDALDKIVDVDIQQLKFNIKHEQYTQPERELLDQIMSMEAIEEHMETSYLASLQKALKQLTQETINK